MNKRETGEQQLGLVTVIVPCYNYAHFLPETLDSILEQEHKNWECIIVNDGSTDDTEKVALAYTQKDSRFKYFFQTNKGLPSARNVGIRQSRGEFLQFLDSDDLIQPRKIRVQLNLMRSYPEAGIVYGDSLFFFGNISNAKRKKSQAGNPIIGRLLVNNIMTVSCALVRKNIIPITGLFDESYSSYEDWHFWIVSALKDIRFHYEALPGTGTYIRHRHTSMLSNKKKLTANAIKLRKFLTPYLTAKQKLYNNYRLTKLYIRRFFSIY